MEDSSFYVARSAFKKTGERNVSLLNIPDKILRFLRDIVTTLIEQKWKCTLSIFSVTYVCCWIFFAGLWWIIEKAHGDLDDNPPAKKCLEGGGSFMALFMFSLEAQVTTGYGARYPTEECPEAIFLLFLQILTSVVMDGSMLGIIFAKISHPPRKSEMKFSRNAVVCLRDGKLCLIFRICDSKQMHVIETKVKAVIMEQKTSMEGEYLGECQSPIKLENDGRIILMWPATVCHVIDSESPFYNLTPDELLKKDFQIILTLLGASWTTGQTTQARMSYVPNEILWGHRFLNVVKYNQTKQVFDAFTDLFQDVVQIPTPKCSARELELRPRILENLGNVYQIHQESVL